AGQMPIVYQADLAGAKERIEQLATRSAASHLDGRIRAALDLQQQDREQSLSDQVAVPDDLRRDPFLRAVYVFSDLAATAWSPAPGRTLVERLDSQKWQQV